MLFALNDLTGALAAYQEGLSIRRKLVADDPTNPERLSDVSSSLVEIGRLLDWRNDPTGALAAYQEGLSIRRKLAADDTTNAERLRGVGASLASIGGVLSARNDLIGAMAAYREGLGIARKLAAHDPTNAERLHDVSIHLDRIGSVLSVRGDLTSKLEDLLESLGIARNFTTDTPNNSPPPIDHGVSPLGEVAVLPFYEHFRFLRVNNISATNGSIYALWSKEDAAIFVLDGSSEPIHEVNEREHLKLTDETVEAYFRFFMFAVRGDEGPFVLYGKPTKGASNAVAQLARPLERSPPDAEDEGGDIAFKAVLAYGTGISQTKFAVSRNGRVVMTDDEQEGRELAPGEMPEVPSLFGTRNDLTGALAAYQESLGIAGKLAADDPTNAERLSQVSIGLGHIGDVLSARNDLTGALKVYQESLGIARKLAADDPTNALSQIQLGISFIKVAQTAEKLGDLRLAGQLFTQATNLLSALAILAPDHQHLRAMADEAADSVARIARLG